MKHVKFVISPDRPEPLAFENSGGAVRVTVFGLAGNDYIYFKRIIEDSEQHKFELNGCKVYSPLPSEIALSVNYQVGDCEPVLYAGRNTIYIAERGRFLPVVVGGESLGSIALQVEAIDLRTFTLAELGVEPCGLPCDKENATWEWTGNERCNGNVIEREYQSSCGDTRWQKEAEVAWYETGVTRCLNNRIEVQEKSDCGKYRWTQTEEACGISPSVPMLIGDGCEQYIGYLFHPSEPRDVGATVGIKDCDGNLVGYAFENAAAGHTLAIEDCDGNVVGYASNRSDTAPALHAACCDDGNQDELNALRDLLNDLQADVKRLNEEVGLKSIQIALLENQLETHKKRILNIENSLIDCDGNSLLNLPDM